VSAKCAKALRQALDSSRLVITHDGPTTQLMMVARLLCLNRTSLASGQDVRRLAGQLATGRYLDLDNEIAAWQLVATACRALLADMPTTLQHDVGLLQGGGLDADSDMRTCVRYRTARKRLLAQAAARLDAFVAASRRVGRVCTILGGPRPSSSVFLLCAGVLPCRQPFESRVCLCARVRVCMCAFVRVRVCACACVLRACERARVHVCASTLTSLATGRLVLQCRPAKTCWSCPSGRIRACSPLLLLTEIPSRRRLAQTASAARLTSSLSLWRRWRAATWWQRRRLLTKMTPASAACPPLLTLARLWMAVGKMTGAGIAEARRASRRRVARAPSRHVTRAHTYT
jgi:hypothetical protein